MTDTPTSLCDYELKVLRAFADNAVDDLCQGAALNAAAETLVSSGYMTRMGGLTEKGAAALGHLHPLTSKVGIA